MGRPNTLPELFRFYIDTVKPLYSTVQLSGSLPVEVLFEINAALDHVSRVWTYEDPEPEAVEKAFSHLKRSCLDIFKLAVKQAMDNFRELRKTDTSIIDNGKFDHDLIQLVAAIKDGARDARANEGNTRHDDGAAVYAFDLWSPVYANCIRLETDFFNNPNVSWAMKKQVKGRIRDIGIGLVMGIIASIIAAYLYDNIFHHTTPASQIIQKQADTPTTAK
jgi:hypothetical protein